MSEVSLKDSRPLGVTEIQVSSLGIGCWAWGDKNVWQYGVDYTAADVQKAYNAALAAGINFFDTAEIYGRGESERLLGAAVKEAGTPVVIASKYAPFPNRFKPGEVETALDNSLARLGVKTIDLYQIHFPYSFIKIEAMMDVLAQAVKAGKIRAVGVSNFNLKQMQRAYNRLEKYGVPLASNQVEYSLLKRKPEANGVLQACKELKISLIAYSPLAKGLLTGKYSGPGSQKPKGARAWMGDFRKSNSPAILQVVDKLKALGEAHGKTPGQVALNWLMTRDQVVIPIPGAKTQTQADQNAAALGWRLTEREMAELDLAAAAFVK